MRTTTVIAAMAGATLLSACAGHSRITSPTGDGAQWFQVSCPWGSDGCFEEAGEACPRGYDVDQRHTKTGKPRNFSAWRSTMIRCKSAGDDIEERPVAAKSKAPTTAPKVSATSPETTSWQKVHAVRWSFTAPAAWTSSSAGKKKIVEDPKGKNEASIETMKWDQPLADFATTRFKSWKHSSPTKIGGREAIQAADFDGTNQSTAVAVVADGIGYQLTCVDIDTDETSATCLKVLRSLRIADAADE